MEPLAQRLRPRTLDEVCGQRHLLAPGCVFRRTIESGKIPNMIFYGPSGVGKTTVAGIIAANSGMRLHKLNGTTASTGDIKSVLSDIGTLGAVGGILLYLDEIQYFNKRQQQSLLECVEQGTVTLIASTTENPYFYVYNALLSRCTVFEFKALTAEDIEQGLRNAAARLGEADGITVTIPDDALAYLAQSAGGDMRKALGNLEFAVTAAPVQDGNRTVTLDMVAQVAQHTAMRYDKLGDDHYDIVSAYQKSMRGSDPDAALHYLARLLEAGDLPSACRRLMVCACEDVGLAYPQIIPIVKAAVDAANMLGLPEARIPLADAVVLVATSPKSNSAYNGINAAMADVKAGKSGPIPRQLQNKHFDGEDALVKGQNYHYAHSYPHHWVDQQYLPDAIRDRVYYTFGDNKNEQAAAAYWQRIKGDAMKKK
ncbi:MAG: replication-associated recombination protein A [Gemmiger sp.]|uniref:replication-associated recombination protein A n=1 Tax=Gemmiger sp. TaxID=2049027 RepID=UPI002E797F03|nr:replication-associated recombination protein A [Gemmiger sp.]MEE0800181.1 replication-associated recombination protein A [Gemmiger sp.]